MVIYIYRLVTWGIILRFILVLAVEFKTAHQQLRRNTAPGYEDT